MTIQSARNIYFIGIGGIGVSAIAQILHQNGEKVSGSDKYSSEITEELQKQGITIYIGHNKANLAQNIDLAIISPAIPENNAELIELTARNIPIITYPEAIGALSQEKLTIAVAGSHGKSTTTAMIGSTLVAASYDPTVIVGTKVREFNHSNVFLGKSKYLVIEACEYKKSFLNLSPDILVLLNIDMDHFDYFSSEEEYVKAFEELINRLPLEGKIIANANDEKVMKLVQKAHCQVITFSVGEKADYSLQSRSVLYYQYNQIGELKLQIPGFHNRENALAAYCACHLLGVPNEITMPNLYRYRGAWRRLDYKGNIGRTMLFDDYAHHPTEIKATILALREEYPHQKICCVFQPHQYNRTKNLLKQLGTSFAGCDEVIIPDIYKVRDTKADVASVRPEDVVNEIFKADISARFGGGLKKTREFLRENAANYDLIVLMGAGDIYEIGKDLLQ